MLVNFFRWSLTQVMGVVAAGPTSRGGTTISISLISDRRASSPSSPSRTISAAVIWSCSERPARSGAWTTMSKTPSGYPYKTYRHSEASTASWLPWLSFIKKRLSQSFGCLAEKNCQPGQAGARSTIVFVSCNSSACPPGDITRILSFEFREGPTSHVNGPRAVTC